MRKRKKKWRKGVVPNEIYVTLNFDENEDRLKQGIEAIIAEYKTALSDDEPPLAISFPAASLKSAQVLLKQLKADLVDAEMNDIVVKMGLNTQTRKGRKTQRVVILSTNWKLSYDFTNISVPLLEDIFNNPEYAGDDYTTKAEIAQSILNELTDVVDVDHLAILPTATEADKTPVNITTPIRMKESATTRSKGALSDNRESHVSFDKAIKSMELVHEELDRPDEVTVAVPNQVGTGTQNIDQPTEPVSKQIGPEMSQEDVSKSRKSKLTTESENISEQPSLSLPRFDVTNLPAVAPENDGYVAYCLNERRRQFNQRQEQLENRLTQDVRRRWRLLTTDYQRDIQQNLTTFKQKLKPNFSAIKQAQVMELNKERQARSEQLKKILDSQKQQEIELAKRQYVAAEQKALQRSEEEYDRQILALDKELSQKGSEQLQVAIEAAQEKVNAELVAYEKDLNRQALGEQQAAIAEWLADSSRVGELLLAKQQKSLQQYEKEVTQIHLAAMEASAANRHAEINLKEVHEQASEVQSLRERLEAVSNKNMSLQGHNQKLQDEVSDVKKELLNQSVAAQKMDKESNKDDLMSVYLMKQLQTGKEKELNDPKINWKHIMAWLMILLIFIGAVGIGSVGYVYTQNRLQMMANRVKDLKKITNVQETQLKKSQSRQKEIGQHLKKTRQELAKAQASDANVFESGSQPGNGVTITWPDN